MANVRTSIDIEVPVEDVWGLMTDLDPRFDDSLSHLKRLAEA
jgi:hypothetical protein